MEEPNTSDAFTQCAPMTEALKPRAPGLLVITLAIGGVFTVAWLGLLGWGASHLVFRIATKILNLW